MPLVKRARLNLPPDHITLSWFLMGWCCSICSVLCLICRSCFVIFVLFQLTIVLSVLQVTASDYHFGTLYYLGRPLGLHIYNNVNICQCLNNVRVNRRDNLEWTIQKNWPHRVHKTKTTKAKSTPQYVLDTTTQS